MKKRADFVCKKQDAYDMKIHAFHVGIRRAISVVQRRGYAYNIG